jgi:hypothetical protein
MIQICSMLIFAYLALVVIMLPVDLVCKKIIYPEQKKLLERACETGNITTIQSYVKQNHLYLKHKIDRCLKIAVQNNQTAVVKFLLYDDYDSKFLIKN